MQLDLTSEEELIRDLSMESFEDFVREFWDTIITEECVWNWHLTVICNELQKLAERVFLGLPKEYDLIINISPGSTKSTIASVMFPAWVWTRMTHARSICCSYSHSLALDLSRKTRDIIQSDLYQRCFPDIKLRADQNTKGFFLNTNNGYRYAVGTGGSVTGFHAHFIIVDDPLNPQEAVSEAELKTANAFMSETLSSRKVDKAITPTILIMQRLHQDDPTGNWLTRMEDKNAGGKVKHICLPADCTEYRVKPKALRRYYNSDNLMDPLRLSRDVLKEQLSTLGQGGFAGQYGQHPVPPGGLMFHTSRLRIQDMPHVSHFGKVCRFWDKAGSHGKGAFTVGALVAFEKPAKDGTEPLCWVLDIVRGQWDSAEREKVIKQQTHADAAFWKSKRKVLIGLEQEPGSGGKESAEATVRRLKGYRVTIDRPTGDKVERADPLSTQVNAHGVIIARGPWNKAFIDELTYFPHSTYKDQVDAASGAFNLLANKRGRVGAL
jgi:predicted phage terminase large subunit-like protein